MSPCPSLSELVLLDEEALPPADDARVRAHWETCASCQARLQDELAAMERRGRERFADRPVQIGRRGDRGYQRLVAAVRHEQTRRRRRHVALGALAAASIVLVVLLARGSLSSIPSAGDVLARATAKERDAMEAAIRHVRIIRTRPGAPDVQVSVELRGGVVTTPTRAQLTRLADADVDLHAPLSAAAFAAWRAQLPGTHRDQVTATDDLLRLLTTAASGQIRLRELLVQRATYRVVGQIWTMADGGRVDVVETWPTPDATPATSAAVNSGAPENSEATLLDERELAARLAVSEIDPEDIVDIDRQDTRVVVTGRVASAASRDALAARLAQQPGVEMRLTSGTAPARRPLGRALDVWASRTLGSDEARRAFATGLQTTAAGVQRHATRLAELARRYPDGIAGRQSPEARRVLQAVVAREYRALVRDLLALDARSTLLGVGTRGLLPPLVEDAPADWRTRVTQARPAADAVRDAVAALLVSEDLSDEQVSAPITQLWHALQPVAVARPK